MEYEFALQKRKIEEQERLIDSLCMTKKVANPSFKGNYQEVMNKASDEAQKNERIA